MMLSEACFLLFFQKQTVLFQLFAFPVHQVGISLSTHPEFKIIILKKRERETNELTNKKKLYNSTCGLLLVSMHTAEVLLVIRAKKVTLNTGSISSNTIHRVPNRKLISAVLFKVCFGFSTNICEDCTDCSIVSAVECFRPLKIKGYFSDTAK